MLQLRAGGRARPVRGALLEKLVHQEIRRRICFPPLRLQPLQLLVSCGAEGGLRRLNGRVDVHCSVDRRHRRRWVECLEL
eukprot:CAMPEP_0113229214 /NCGR_PEP_ID=MMETSP0008_2-20120614/233_1 /TAXON_ID=97485 /ORGANISM="Prymnesium parvum" /LENGTH=79 /DNA_ID=CAMNT_0000075719 /DNA_START=781 /DNA_END=1023 /DNA_ORIENTATION=- /assembly_acc=CAM_ASM_000153